MRHWLLCFMFFFSLAGTAGAQGVRAFVDRNQAVAGETIQLTVSVESSKADVDISPIQDFKVVSQSSGTSIQTSNGRTRMEVMYVYTLLPLKEGKLKIPKLPVTVDDRTEYTGEIVIDVSRKPVAGQERGDIFVSAEVSAPTPYVGQQITYIFKLTQAVQVSNARFQPPEFNGFTAKEIEDHKSYRTIIAGREHIVTEVTYILLPISSGEKNIEQALLQCSVPRPRTGSRAPLDSFFDDPFFGRSRMETKVFNTEPIDVTVRPLPVYEGTAPFSGLVGQFRIHSQIENNRLKAGDSTTLSVTVEGNGNIMDAEAPSVSVPDGFKTYTDTPQEEIRLTPGGYEGKKVFRTALVPVSAGEYQLPAVDLTYFDITDGHYRTVKTQPAAMTVSPADERKNTLSVYAPPDAGGDIIKKKVEFTGRDILPPKEGLDAITPMRPLSPARFLIWLMGPALLSALGGIGLMLTKKRDDPESVMVQKSMEALKKAAKPNTPVEDFLSCLYKALTAAILSKSGTLSESLTYTEAHQILISAGFDAQLAADASRLLETVESAGYSGTPLDKRGREDLLKQTQDFIRRLSK